MLKCSEQVSRQTGGSMSALCCFMRGCFLQSWWHCRGKLYHLSFGLDCRFFSDVLLVHSKSTNADYTHGVVNLLCVVQTNAVTCVRSIVSWKRHSCSRDCGATICMTSYHVSKWEHLRPTGAVHRLRVLKWTGSCSGELFHERISCTHHVYCCRARPMVSLLRRAWRRTVAVESLQLCQWIGSCSRHQHIWNDSVQWTCYALHQTLHKFMPTLRWCRREYLVIMIG